jgi:hypothetical protein
MTFADVQVVIDIKWCAIILDLPHDAHDRYDQEPQHNSTRHPPEGAFPKLHGTEMNNTLKDGGDDEFLVDLQFVWGKTNGRSTFVFHSIKSLLISATKAAADAAMIVYTGWMNRSSLWGMRESRPAQMNIGDEKRIKNIIFFFVPLRMNHPRMISHPIGATANKNEMLKFRMRFAT